MIIRCAISWLLITFMVCLKWCKIEGRVFQLKRRVWSFENEDVKRSTYSMKLFVFKLFMVITVCFLVPFASAGNEWGCDQGYCWRYCGLTTEVSPGVHKKNWCYTDNGLHPERYNRERATCKYDSHCGRLWLCATPCGAHWITDIIGHHVSTFTTLCSSFDINNFSVRALVENNFGAITRYNLSSDNLLRFSWTESYQLSHLSPEN